MKITALATLALAVLAASPALAQHVEIAPYAGYQFGGGFASVDTGAELDIGSGLTYGGSLDIPISENWRVEAFYSRQATELALDNVYGPGLDVTQQRVLIGLKEIQGSPDDRSRPYGIAYVGATRWDSGLSGYDSETRATVGFGLGIRSELAKSVGIRVEGRGFYTVAESGGGMICSGGRCLVAFESSGIWQGEVAGALFVSF